MDAKIMYKGMEISVPIAGLGYALEQLEQMDAGKKAVDATAKPAQPPRAEPRKVPSSPAQQPWPLPVAKAAEAFAADLAVAAAAPPLRVLPPISSAPAVALLKLLNDHQVSGVSPADVQQVLGAEHPKGVGSKMGNVNAVLRASGVDPAEVYSNDRRDSEGRRIWAGGPKLKEALGKLTEDK